MCVLIEAQPEMEADGLDLMSVSADHEVTL